MIIKSADTLSFQAEAPPLRLDDGGVVRVGSSRIALDLIVEQFENGMSADEMARAYDTLDLADVHAVIAYYLRHGDEVQAYLQRRGAEASALRKTIESQRRRVTREQLLARRSVRGKEHASPGN